MGQVNKAVLINQKQAIRFLGYGNEQPGLDILEALEICAKKLYSVLQPKYLFHTYQIVKERDCCSENNGLIKLEGTDFTLPGKSIKKHLENCEKAVLCCATLSEDVDLLIQEVQQDSMLDSLLLDALSNAAVEELRFQMEEEAAEQNKGYEKNWMFGIGYGDLPLSLQSPLLQLLNAEKQIGLYANKNSLLIPLKSVTGVIGLKKEADQNNIDSYKPLCFFESKADVLYASKNEGCNICNIHDHCSYRKRE